MPENSLKITRNFRGGILRMIRIAVACVLLYYGVRLLTSLVFRTNPAFDTSLSPLKAGLAGVTAGSAILLGVYWLMGTLVRAFGVLLFIFMVPFVIVGHLLTLAGAPEITRRLPMAYLLVGCTLIYTGRGEWTLVPFAIRQMRESLARVKSAG